MPDPFWFNSRRGYPPILPTREKFRGPWGEGYTEELASFEEWLRVNKASDKHNPSGWIAVVVDGIAKGGSRALWHEFKASCSGNGDTSEEEAMWERQAQALLDKSADYIEAKQAWLEGTSGDERKRRDKFFMDFLSRS